MTDYFKAAVTLLAVINPVVCGVMLLQIEGKLAKKNMIFAATKSALTVLLILIYSALVGKYILNAFGISMDVFQIVGDVIIAYLGFGIFNPAPPPGREY